MNIIKNYLLDELRRILEGCKTFYLDSDENSITGSRFLMLGYDIEKVIRDVYGTIQATLFKGHSDVKNWSKKKKGVKKNE